MTKGAYSRLEVDDSLAFSPRKMILSTNDLVQAMEDSVAADFGTTLRNARQSQRAGHDPEGHAHRLLGRSQRQRDAGKPSIPAFTIAPKPQRRRALGCVFANNALKSLPKPHVGFDLSGMSCLCATSA